jgi:CSLREA domain-containing protein
MNRHWNRLASLALILLFLGPAARAATVDVTTATDEADGSCLDGDCSLRDAIASANAGDTVAVPAGNYLLVLGQIVIPRDISIAGAGARSTILQGNGSARHFQVPSARTVTISGLALTAGRGSQGGSIDNSGTLTLRQVAAYGNRADVAGAIYSFGRLTLIDSAVTGNQAMSVGGIYSDLQPLSIENSTLSANTGNLLAGGLAAIGPATLLHTTIAGNSVTQTASWQGGGAFLVGDSTATASLFDGNSPANCDLPVTTAAASLDSDGSCGFGPGNLSGVAAQLLPLANNGGPTDTHPLSSASPAIDLAASCLLAADQRGITRPQGGGCDAGAFELAGTITPTTLCEVESFDSGLGTLEFDHVGDSDQGGAAVSGGRLQLTSDGSAFYHGSDNGGFLHRSATGDFHIETTLTGFPSNTGGGYRRSGITVRSGTGPNDPRVYIEFLPQHPSYQRSALMFDYRGTDGVARELGSTQQGLALPLKIAIERRGDLFTVWYSPDGTNWNKPAGGAGGAIEIAMPATVEVGLMQASYDTSVTLTAEFEHFELCRPNPEPLPPPPSPAACLPGQPLDVVYLVDASGSSRNGFPGTGGKLDAARQAIVRLNDHLEANLPGSRAALISFSGGAAPAYVTGPGFVLRSPLTASLATVDSAAGAIPPAPTTTNSSPLSHALTAARQLLIATGSPAARPVVVVLGDGFVNVDAAGNGPGSYRSLELLAISPVDGGGNYRGIGEMGWLGNWNGPVHTFDGEALANAMAETLFLKQQLPSLSLNSLGLHGGGAYYRADLLGFLADYGGGTYAEATDAASLAAAADATWADLACTP